MTRRPPGQLSIDGRPMTEAELQRDVIALARSLGWGITQSAAAKLARDAAAYGIPEPPLEGLVFHPRYSLGSEPGWPDLTLIRRRDRRLVFAELKAEKGRLSERQDEVLELLRYLEWPPADGAVPGAWEGVDVPRIEVHVWRPSDLLDGTIEGVLR
jgi:hypothetical protein